MPSETRRIANALIAHRVERFESRHGLAQSQARLRDALQAARVQGSVAFTPAWKSEGNATVLEATFDPPPKTQRFLQSMSLAITVLIALSIWAAMAATGPALAWLLPMFTVLAVLALPFVFVAMGSNREAEEARIRRAIRVALLDEDAAFPPQQRWKDED